MTINAADKQYCPSCKGNMYLAFTTPVKWVHISTDTTKCSSRQKFAS